MCFTKPSVQNWFRIKNKTLCLVGSRDRAKKPRTECCVAYVSFDECKCVFQFCFNYFMIVDRLLGWLLRPFLSIVIVFSFVFRFLVLFFFFPCCCCFSLIFPSFSFWNGKSHGKSDMAMLKRCEIQAEHAWNMYRM